MMYKEIFMENFNLVRVESGLSMKELADTLDTSVTNISNWSRGRTLPREDSLLKIADTFSVDADWLLGMSSVPRQSMTRLDTWLVDVMEAEDEKKEALKKMWFAIKDL